MTEPLELIEPREPRYIVFDTETTGITADRKAVEVGLIEIDKDLNELDRLRSLIDPEMPIHPMAQQTHGISLESLADEPTIEEFVSEIMGGKLDGEIVLIGHKIEFDYPMFHGIIGDVRNTFCTLELAQEMVSREEVPNHKLETLRDHFQIQSGDSHSALGDCETCLGLLRLWIPQSGRALEDWCEPGLKIIHRMPWGKHAGCPLVDLPKGYRFWLLGLQDISKNLRHSLLELSKAGL